MSIKALYFDMDGTLHNFSASAGTAMENVYDHILNNYKLKIGELKKKYAEIMAQTEKNAFFDGRSSTEYRKERLDRLLGAFNVHDNVMVGRLLGIYAETLEKKMRPYDGAIDMLERLSQKKPLYIVTEGPSDAQRRAVEILGFSPYFQSVFISGEVKKIKETGELFRHAMEKTGYKAGEVVSIGDSYERDVIGGLNAGLYVVWFNRKNEQLKPEDVKPHAQISDIKELEGILEEQFGV